MISFPPVTLLSSYTKAELWLLVETSTSPNEPVICVPREPVVPALSLHCIEVPPTTGDVKNLYLRPLAGIYLSAKMFPLILPLTISSIVAVLLAVEINDKKLLVTKVPLCIFNELIRSKVPFMLTPLGLLIPKLLMLLEVKVLAGIF